MADSDTSLDEIRALRNDNIGRLLLRAYRDFQQRSAQKLQTRGYGDLTLAHLSVLPHIDVVGTRIVTLAERVSMTKQSMGQLVQELEERGYVQRVTDATDRRAVIVTFTEHGMQFLHDAYAIKLEIGAEYEALLGAGGLQKLCNSLGLLLKDSDDEPMG